SSSTRCSRAWWRWWRSAPSPPSAPTCRVCTTSSPPASATSKCHRHQKDTVMTLFHRLLHEDEGQNLVEYALLAGLVALVALGAVASLGTNLSGLYSSLANKLTGLVQ